LGVMANLVRVASVYGLLVPCKHSNHLEQLVVHVETPYDNNDECPDERRNGSLKLQALKAVVLPLS